MVSRNSKRRLLLAIAVATPLAVGVLASRPAAAAPEAAGMRIEDQNKQVVTRYLKALGAGDMDTIQSLLADDMHWIVPQDPALSRLAGSYDKAGLLKLLSGFRKVMPNGATFTPIGMTAEGDRVAVEAVGQADTPAGPFHNQYHFLFVIRDGKVVVGKEYADSLYMQDFGKRSGREAPR